MAPFNLTNAPKIISPKAHGVIDYAHAAFFFGLALVCGKRNKPASYAALGTGAFILVQSMLTDYPLGVKRIIPFAVHGTMDRGFASASWIVPALFGFKGTVAAKIFESNSAIEAAVVSLTDWDSERAREETLRPRLVA